MSAATKPPVLRLALGLLWLALAIGIGASLRYYATLDALPLGDVAGHLLGYAILALLLLGIGAGNAWARILFLLLLAWNLGLVLVNLALSSPQLPWLYRLDQLILGLQCLAALLLFAPASSAWFRQRR
jgi:hypothetical protein